MTAPRPMPSRLSALLDELSGELDPRFFKALSDPARVEQLKLLIVHGPMDVDSLAQHFTQDRSVVSRHLAALAAVGVLRAEKQGRHVVYQADADFVLDRLERIADLIRRVRAICCPPGRGR